MFKFIQKFGHNIYHQLQKSLFVKSIILLISKLPVLFISLIFLLSLYFCNSNKSLLILSLIYLVALYLKTKDFKQALVYSFMITLPFAKGKSFEMRLIDKDDIVKNAVFNISYFAPLYLADFYLSLIVWLYLRPNKNQIKKINANPWPNYLLIVYFLLCVGDIFFAVFPNLILLASLQLLKFFLIFNLSCLLKEENFFSKNFKNFYQIISALNFFQFFWVLLQKLNQGPLGKYIEAQLPGAEYGIKSFENADLLRLSGTFFEPSILGTFILMNLAISLYLLKNKQQLPVKLVITNIVANLITIILTASRGVYFLTAILFLLNFRKQTFQQLHKQKKYFFYILLILLIPFILFFNFFKERLKSTSSLFDKEGSGTYRVQIAQYSLKLLDQNLWIGVGSEHSPYYLATSFPNDDYIFDPAHPHNLFVQILVENGLLGFIFFILFIYFSIRTQLIKKKKSIFFWPVLIYLICAQLYPIYTSIPELSSWLFFYLGLMVYEK